MGSWNPNPNVIRYENFVVRYVPSSMLAMVPWIFAVIDQESGGNPNAVSSAGAIGLMQVLPSTAADYGVVNASQLTDPETNIRVGVAHLVRLKRKFWLLAKALTAYFWGEGNVSRWSASELASHMSYANSVRDKAVNKYLADADYFIEAEHPSDNGSSSSSSSSSSSPSAPDIKKILPFFFIGLVGAVALLIVLD